MPRYSRDPEDLNYGARFESRLDRDSHREPRVAIRRVATSPADQLERIALKCSAAFREHDCTGDECCPVCHANISIDEIERRDGDAMRGVRRAPFTHTSPATAGEE